MQIKLIDGYYSPEVSHLSDIWNCWVVLFKDQVISTPVEGHQSIRMAFETYYVLHCTGTTLSSSAPLTGKGSLDPDGASFTLPS